MTVREQFHEFCRLELASGGPDPQVELTARATDNLSDHDAAIFAGCFVTPYTCGAAGPLFVAQAAMRETEPLHQWIEANWAGLPTRRERRAVWNKRKMAESLLSWIDWVEVEWPRVRALPYPDVYDSVQKYVRYYGRYAIMKVLEVMYQRGLIDNQQSDIRPNGAKYPRRTLAELFPDQAIELNSGGSRKIILHVADACAYSAKQEAEVVSWFDFETLLCNYRQSLAGKYPGRSHDRELAHFIKAEQYWGQQIHTWFPFYSLRRATFEPAYLGELNDPPWYGARPELEAEWKARYK